MHVRYLSIQSEQRKTFCEEKRSYKPLGGVLRKMDICSVE